MIDVIESVDLLIDELRKSDFVINMLDLKKEIDINNLDISNDIVHKYIENQNILDLHIFYLNRKIKEITKGV